MDLHAIFEALQSTPFAVAIAESDTLFPIIETVHVFALTMVVGSIAMLDLRLLQVSSRDISVTQLSKEVLPWTWCCFALAASSGFLMFSSKAVKYAGNFSFRAKMVMLLLAGTNMILFHLLTWRTVRHWDEHPRTPAAAKLAGGLSLLFWICVVAFGRWVGFTL